MTVSVELYVHVMLSDVIDHVYLPLPEKHQNIDTLYHDYFHNTVTSCTNGKA